MKKLLLAGFLFFSINAFAQTEEIETNCYQKYAKIFEERGAENVPDGVYDDIIITIRYGSNADCYTGKITVSEGKVIMAQTYLKFQDGTYDLLAKKYKNDFPITVVNGISRTIVTVEDELINVMFVKKIKPKKKSYERAPEPSIEF